MVEGSGYYFGFRSTKSQEEESNLARSLLESIDKKNLVTKIRLERQDQDQDQEFNFLSLFYEERTSFGLF